jgi:hypothetical protein
MVAPWNQLPGEQTNGSQKQKEASILSEGWDLGLHLILVGNQKILKKNLGHGIKKSPTIMLLKQDWTPKKIR